jgi:hypothetical protein
MTQLFDQATTPDPAAPRAAVPARAVDLDRIFNTEASNALDLSRFSSSRGPHNDAPRPAAHDWLRGRIPTVALVLMGAALGVAVARL